MEAIKKHNFEYQEYNVQSIKLVDVEKFKYTNVYHILRERLKLAKVYPILKTEAQKIQCITQIQLYNELISRYLNL